MRDDDFSRSPLVRGGSVGDIEENRNKFGRNVTEAAEAIFNLKILRPGSEEHHPTERSYNGIDVGHLWRGIHANVFGAGDRVLLKDVSLTEWLPLSPGLFHTKEAAFSRSKSDYDHARKEYIPGGKASMLSGGIGCIRVAARPLVRQDFVIFNATSDPDAHSGILVRLAVADADAIVDEIQYSGLVTADVQGTIRRLSFRDLHLQSAHLIRNYIIEVDSIRPRSAPKTRQLRGTGAIAFGSNEAIAGSLRGRKSRPGTNRIYYSFAQFDIGNESSINNACEWLEEYIQRHRSECGIELDDIAIASDFDDSMSRFQLPVLFGLKDANPALFAEASLRAAAGIKYVGKNKCVFVSYRSTDAFEHISAHVGRVFDYLTNQSLVQHIFWDRLSLRAGDNWQDQLQKGIEKSDVVLAFIGPQWERDGTDKDWVHEELRLAQKNQRKIVPVMIGGRKMHSVDFPPDLKPLSSLQALSLDHANFEKFQMELMSLLVS